LHIYQQKKHPLSVIRRRPKTGVCRLSGDGLSIGIE
jgi:hypothetical protein